MLENMLKTVDAHFERAQGNVLAFGNELTALGEAHARAVEKRNKLHDLQKAIREMIASEGRPPC